MIVDVPVVADAKIFDLPASVENGEIHFVTPYFVVLGLFLDFYTANTDSKRGIIHVCIELFTGKNTHFICTI